MSAAQTEIEWLICQAHRTCRLKRRKMSIPDLWGDKTWRFGDNFIWTGSVKTNNPAFLLLESQLSNYFEAPKEVNHKETDATTLILDTDHKIKKFKKNHLYLIFLSIYCFGVLNIFLLLIYGLFCPFVHLFIYII